MNLVQDGGCHPPTANHRPPTADRPEPRHFIYILKARLLYENTLFTTFPSPLTSSFVLRPRLFHNIAQLTHQLISYILIVLHFLILMYLLSSSNCLLLVFSQFLSANKKTRPELKNIKSSFLIGNARSRVFSYNNSNANTRTCYLSLNIMFI